MRFRATLELNGTTATGIQVPEEVVAALGPSKRPPVQVTINGQTCRSSVARTGGRFMLPVSAEHRRSAGVVAGDVLEIDIALDTEPRVVSVPPDFAEALDRDDDARRRFDGLPHSHQQQHVSAIDDAKTAETRQRRIAKAVTMLRSDPSA